ncbi:FimD/PapC C-terminal domain-containing protein [Enterobacter hormaechei]
MPRRGSVTRASFKVSSGRRVQFVLTTASGKRVPLGARVQDAEDRLLGVVDNQSSVLLFGLTDEGSLRVKWSEGQCVSPYRLPKKKSNSAYDVIHVACG